MGRQAPHDDYWLVANADAKKGVVDLGRKEVRALDVTRQGAGMAAALELGEDVVTRFDELANEFSLENGVHETVDDAIVRRGGVALSNGSPGCATGQSQC